MVKKQKYTLFKCDIVHPSAATALPDCSFLMSGKTNSLGGEEEWMELSGRIVLTTITMMIRATDFLNAVVTGSCDRAQFC